MRLCLRPQVKIAWSFYQVATLIPVVYLVQLPKQVEEVLDLFRISIELEAYNIHISCYGEALPTPRATAPSHQLPMPSHRRQRR